MLSVEHFKARLNRSNSPDWLRVVIDANNESQFYIVSNGGMGNTISTPIENFLPEFKKCVMSMISARELIKDEKKSLLLDRNILVHYLSITPYAKG